MSQLDLQVASEQQQLPDAGTFSEWIKAALPVEKQDWELTIRVVDLEESQQLNRDYRAKDKPTNVLSFPSDLPPELNIPLLGDIVICAPVVMQEAAEQHKPALAHWAHLTVHGCLHLLGYDHEEDADANIMEALETRILIGLGFADPYTSNLG